MRRLFNLILSTDTSAGMKQAYFILVGALLNARFVRCYPSFRSYFHCILKSVRFGPQRPGTPVPLPHDLAKLPYVKNQQRKKASATQPGLLVLPVAQLNLRLQDVNVQEGVGPG